VRTKLHIQVCEKSCTPSTASDIATTAKPQW
jgi:hypothetical protein